MFYCVARAAAHGDAEKRRRAGTASGRRKQKENAVCRKKFRPFFLEPHAGRCPSRSASFISPSACHSFHCRPFRLHVVKSLSLLSCLPLCQSTTDAHICSLSLSLILSISISLSVSLHLSGQCNLPWPFVAPSTKSSSFEEKNQTNVYVRSGAAECRRRDRNKARNELE